MKQFIKNLIARFVCWFKKRHTKEYMKEHGGKFHQFYTINGGGMQCTCPYCGYHVILK